MKWKLLGLAFLIVGLGLVGSLGPGPASATQAPPNLEDFETGDFSRFPWETGGDAPWVMTPVSHSGAYAVQAGKIGDNQRSWLKITFNVTQEGQIGFWYRVSSEADFDFLRFFIDGQAQGSWSGDIGWQQASFPITVGTYSLRWEYAKDGSGAFDKDTAYLDDITFPPAAVFGPVTPLPPPGMALIPAGSFAMGDSFGGEGDSDELPVHTVTVSAFYMDQFEVMKALWDEVATWAAANGYDIGPGDGSGKGANHPVYNVSWYEAVKWANARSEREGLTPVYYTSPQKSAAMVYRTGRVDVQNNSVDWSANGYRLPTEAEWEKAARGGVEGRRFPWSDTDTIQHARANYWSRSDESYDTSPTKGFHPDYDNDPQPYTSPVGSFAPNGYGLYDMAGNVWEWVWDWYDSDYYAISPGDDPRGPASGLGRVLRGGSWYDYAIYCRVALRFDPSPGYVNDDLGFRLVRTAMR